MAKDPFALSRSKAKPAMDKTRSMLGATIDPQLAKYKELTEADFGSLAAEFGEAPVSKYIEKMERRNLQSRRK